MRTTKTQFKRFQKEFNKVAFDLGLSHYSWIIELAHLPNSQSMCTAQPHNKVAIITLDNDGIDDSETPESLARHEAMHLLLADLVGLAHWRYSQKEEIKEEEERIVNRLEKYLF